MDSTSPCSVPVRGWGRLLGPALALGLLFAWLLAVPLSGPVLARSSAPSLGALTAAQAFALVHGLSLLALGVWTLWRPLASVTRWAGAVTAMFGLLLAVAPTSWWPFLLLGAGVTAAGSVLAVATSIAHLPWEGRPWAIALGAGLANVLLYVASLPEHPVPDRPLAAVLALGPLALPFLLGPRPWEDKGFFSLEKSFVALVVTAFCAYLVGGLMYSLILPALGQLGLRIGVLPYMALLPAAAWTANLWGRNWAIRRGLALLGVGFMIWALAQGAGREVAAQGLVVGGFAFLDVPFWAAFADQGGRPSASFGVGLGAMMMAIFAGMALGDNWAAALQGREEEAALVAGMCLFLATTLVPHLWQVEEQTDTSTFAPEARNGFGLSRREAQVVALAIRGLTNKEIAKTLGLSEGTVRKHLERTYRKLRVRGRVEALSLLYRQKQPEA